MKNVEKFKELTTILITKCLRLEARDVDKRTKQIERINETEQELIKMYEELEECADDNTPENEENLLKHLNKNNDLDIRFSFFSEEEGDHIPVKIYAISIEHAHIHNNIEFDDEDEFLNYLEFDSGYDKKTIKKLKNEFHFSPFLNIMLEEKL